VQTLRVVCFFWYALHAEKRHEQGNTTPVRLLFFAGGGGTMCLFFMRQQGGAPRFAMRSSVPEHSPLAA
jgi:hypothetical protein